jgi:sterol desaturase/sphingolipid hydroxylase (fatty acid hydroxylase superfamily)
MDINPIILAIPVYFILIGVEVLYDRLNHKKRYRLNDAITNISCGITEQATGVFVKVFTVAVYHFFFVNFAIFSVPETVFWTVVLFLGVDFFYYWAHRMSHQINLFWIGHIVHHQSEDYNFSVALRQGALQKVFTSVFYIPLAVIGFKTEWFLFIGAFTTLYQFWIHTEMIDKLPRWFEFIFNTPSHHRVHHGRNEKYLDKNHAGTLIIWDRMFDTFQKEEEKPDYGVTSQTATFDPIKAHIDPIKALWKNMNAFEKSTDKLRVLYKSPAWLAKQPQIDLPTHPVEKYNSTIGSDRGYYILFQYAIILGITAFFLFQFSIFEVVTKVSFLAFILFSVMVIGKLLDQSKTGSNLELLRLFVTLIFTLTVSVSSMFPTLLYSSIILLEMISLIWFFNFGISAKPVKS